MTATLIAEFGSLRRIFSARRSRLERVGDWRVVEVIMSCRRVALEALRPEPGRSVLDHWRTLDAYFDATLAGETVEQVRVLFLDSKNGLIRDQLLAIGTINECTVHVREVMHRALDLGAAALILVHNHPSGDPSPSRSDIEFTRAAIAAGEPLLVSVHDHIIVGTTGRVSLRAMGIDQLWR